MEKKIRQLLWRIRLAYALLWLLSAAIVLAGECNLLPVGAYAAEVRTAYVAESVLILLTAFCVPSALKLFAWWQRRYINRDGLLRALSSYLWASLSRLALLALPAWGGMTLYYLLWSGKGALCTAIALTASLFCWPSGSRIRYELHLDPNNE